MPTLVIRVPTSVPLGSRSGSTQSSTSLMECMPKKNTHGNIRHHNHHRNNTHHRNRHTVVFSPVPLSEDFRKKQPLLMTPTDLPQFHCRAEEDEDEDNKGSNADDDNHQWIEFFENSATCYNRDDKDKGKEGATAGRSSSFPTIKTEKEGIVPNSIPSNSSMLDMEDKGREGATAGRSSSSITIKTEEEEEIPDSIPSNSSMLDMEEEEKDENVFTSIINNTLVWGDSTITGRVNACEGQH